MADSLEAVIDAAHREAAGAFPDVAVTRERFGAELARRLGDGLTADLVPSLCTRDVYLAIACIDGDARAAVHVDSCLDVVDAVARRMRASADQAGDLRGHLHKILFTAEPDRHAGLADFTGRGDLRGYIKVIASRELVRMLDRAKKERPAESIIETLAIERAPELEILRAKHGDAVAAALRDALAKLPERERALLRYSIVDGWSVDQIGKLYGVHRSSAARWVADARDALADAVRGTVAASLAVDADEVDSLIAVLRSRIDVSLARIL